MNSLLIIDWDNYLSRLFYTNQVVIEKTDKDKEDIINVEETIYETLKIIDFLNNLIKYWHFSKIIFTFDTKTWKDNNIKIMNQILEKHGLLHEWYKWTRNSRPAFDLFKKHFQNILYFKWFEIQMSDKYEADDVMWTIAKKEENNYDEICILSKDQDLYQIVNDKIKILNGIWKKDLDKKINISELKLMFHIKKWIKLNNSDDIIIYKSIVWDKSDNIPWVKWIRDKKLSNSLKWKQSIKESDIYLENKDLIEDFVPLIRLNTNIDDKDIKKLIYKWSDSKYYWYISKNIKKDNSI